MLPTPDSQSVKTAEKKGKRPELWEKVEVLSVDSVYDAVLLSKDLLYKWSITTKWMTANIENKKPV